MKIKVKNMSSNNLKMVGLIFLLIYIIYEPELTGAFLGIHSYYVNVIAVLGLIVINFKQFLKIEKRLLYFCIVVFATALYTLVVTSVSGNAPRFFQHIYVIFQVLALYLVNVYIDNNFKDGYKTKIDLTKGFILAEFIISVLMIFIEPLKDFAVTIYYALSDGTINEFVVSKRIYGIYGDYTFKCQIMNGLFAFFFLTKVFKERKPVYLLYTVFSLVISILNGRTGTLIFIVTTFVFILYVLFSDKKKRARNISLLFRVGVVFGISVALVYALNPDTFKFLLNMFYNFMGRDTGTDNNLLFISESVVFPEGWQFVFGSGEVYYGSKTDIGYCNDIALVGILVTAIQYINLFIFLKPHQSDKNNKWIFLCLVIGMLLTNVKGVCMRNGTIVIGVLWLRMIYESENAIIKRGNI